MRMLVLLVLLTGNLTVVGQKWVGDLKEEPIRTLIAKSHFAEALVGSDVNSIHEHLRSTIPALRDESSDVELVHQVASPLGKHFLFQQTIDGEKVMGATVKINLDIDGIRTSLFDRTIEPQLASGGEFPDTLLIRQRLLELYNGKDMDNLSHAKVERVYFFNGQNLVPSVRIEVTEMHDHYYEMVLDSDVKVMYQNDLLAYHRASVDSPVTAFVFLPDPLTTAEEQYGSPYVDADDADISQLNEQMQEVTIEADFNGTFFTLESPWISFNEHSGPTNTPAISSTPEFNFTREDDRFEEVNTFYHINTYQQHIQDLGFNNLVNYQISVDVHALNGADNSNFNNSHSPPRLSFGDGGVDDAEDADVIIHEYGHAIMHSAAPGTNGGTERRALDEGIGDYFAASYSRHLSEYGWQRVYSWDGHNEFWNGRVVESSKHYPENLVGNIYADAEIWSSTLMQIWGDIGRDKTDRIMLQSAYSYAEGMSMPDAAQLFLNAEQALYGGQYEWQVRHRMFERGLISELSVDEQESTPFKVFGTEGFAGGVNPVKVIFNEPTDATVQVYDVAGRVLIAEQLSGNTTWSLQPNAIRSAGTYTVTVTADDSRKSFKLLRLID